MDGAQIEHYLRLLGVELQQRGVTGEIMQGFFLFAAPDFGVAGRARIARVCRVS